MMRDGLPLAAPDTPSLRADPLADDAIGRILGDSAIGAGPDLDTMLGTIALVNAQLARWQLNGDLAGWRAGAGVPPEIARGLEDYVAASSRLPDWADADKIARAERIFMDMSMLSCTLLFCASLPQCYVIPDLAAVLQVAGQLDQHTDYRIRSTAAMIFPVMMRGGLTDPSGGGVAQAIKVRLIHATIRHLILRGAPQQALAAGPVPPLAPRGAGLQQTLYAHGWDSAQRGLPCNQEELAYTLLTFSYVFLMGLRRLGLGLPAADEEAYLHAWNVLGHLLGIERALMADSMDAARVLFEGIQARGQVRTPDARPALATALARTLQRYIPFTLLKPFPVLLTRHLCGAAASKDLGLDGHVSWLSRALFALGMGAVLAVDASVRLFAPGFSISRLVGRILGYRLTVTLLMDQTRPLKLPTALLGQVDDVVRGWRDDPKAPRWMNALERHYTKG
jgi:hypothetical protein